MGEMWYISPARPLGVSGCECSSRLGGGGAAAGGGEGGVTHTGTAVARRPQQRLLSEQWAKHEGG